MLMCSPFPDDVLGAGAEPKGETNETNHEAGPRLLLR